MTTDRLVLRELRADDAEALRAYYRRNAERFALWLPARADDLAFHRQWIEERARMARQNGHPVAFVAHSRESGDLVGLVTLDSFTADPPGAMMNYNVDGAYEGRGYAGEAVDRVVRYALEEGGLEVISACYDPANTRSGALLERLGFAVVARTPVVPGLERFMRPQVLAMRRAP